MSSTFGVPPPPAPASIAPSRTKRAPKRAPEPDRWRRRAAVTAAFIAVSLLTFANIASWLHHSVIAPGGPSNQVAASTFDEASRTYTRVLTPALTAQVRAAGERAYGPDNSDALAELLEGERSKIDQIARWATQTTIFRTLWYDAVDVAMARQRVLANGTPPISEEVGGDTLLHIDGAALKGAITSGLITNGYFFMSDETLVLPDLTVQTRVSAYDYRSVLGGADQWWLLLIVLTIAFGAAAIALASRRLRMVTIMAIDAVVMLGGTLLLVPLMHTAAVSHLVDDTQAGLAHQALDALTDSLVVQTLVLMIFATVAAVAAAIIARGQRQRAAETLEAAA